MATYARRRPKLAKYLHTASPTFASVRLKTAPVGLDSAENYMAVFDALSSARSLVRLLRLRNLRRYPPSSTCNRGGYTTSSNHGFPVRAADGKRLQRAPSRLVGYVRNSHHDAVHYLVSKIPSTIRAGMAQRQRSRFWFYSSMQPVLWAHLLNSAFAGVGLTARGIRMHQRMCWPLVLRALRREVAGRIFALHICGSWQPSTATQSRDAASGSDSSGARLYSQRKRQPVQPVPLLLPSAAFTETRPQQVTRIGIAFSDGDDIPPYFIHDSQILLDLCRAGM
jgi:hypothetical protein